MKTLTQLFMLMALVGMLTGHVGGALAALVWAGVCYYAAKRMQALDAVVDTEQELVQAASIVLAAQTADNL